MGNIIPIEALAILNDRFGCDSLIALATVDGTTPCVRAVNSYYEGGAFYVITHAQSNKMKQIEANPNIAICGEWFTAHGVGENLGYVLHPKNADMMDKLRVIFDEWYDNGHVDESDTNTILLRIRLTDGVLLANGDRYELHFS